MNSNVSPVCYAHVFIVLLQRMIRSHTANTTTTAHMLQNQIKLNAIIVALLWWVDFVADKISVLEPTDAR